MSHPHRHLHPRRPRPALLVAVPVALVLSGCGASMDAQTYAPRTQVDGTNVTLEELAVRNARVEPPAGGIAFEQGGEATVTMTVVNRGEEDDTLESVTTEAAEEAVVLDQGRPGEVEVPAGGISDSASVVLRGLSEELLVGQYVELTLRFTRAGDVEALVPVATTGRAGRPVYTGEPGSEEGEPALGGPAGGHSEEEGEEEG